MHFLCYTHFSTLFRFSQMLFIPGRTVVEYLTCQQRPHRRLVHLLTTVRFHREASARRNHLQHHLLLHHRQLMIHRRFGCRATARHCQWSGLRSTQWPSATLRILTLCPTLLLLLLLPLPLPAPQRLYLRLCHLPPLALARNHHHHHRHHPCRCTRTPPRAMAWWARP